MRAEEHVKRHAGEILDGEQQVAGGHVFARFPVAPGGCGHAERVRGGGDTQFTALAPVFEPHAERDACGVMMAAMTRVHRWEVDSNPCRRELPSKT